MARPPIIQPNSVNVEAQFKPGPTAQPVTATISNGAEIKLMTIGGFTKLEYVAAMVFAHNWNISGHRAVLAAQELLAACQEAQTPPPQTEISNGNPR